MATIAQSVPIVARELKLPVPYVEQRTRRLREAGLLPASVGRHSPSLRVEHLATLVLALVADAQVKDAPAAAETYGGLALHGIDPTVMPEHIRPSGHTVRHYLEHILASLAIDDAYRRLTIELVSSWPEIRIHDPEERHTYVFTLAGTSPTHWQNDAVRRSTTIHARALSRIVRAIL